MGKPVVAIIGRQNVGKSTLLNRLAGKNVAIVEDLPGTTRDRVAVDVSWQGKEFTLIDTGGLELKPETSIAQKVKEQAEKAIEQADVVVFLTDVQAGLSTLDLDIADKLRQSSKPIILVVNKADNEKLEAAAAEFYELGIGDPLPVSAYHGRGTTELLDKILPLLPPSSPTEVQPTLMKVAIVGHPGVGKSMLLNTILGMERVIVGEVPGTTRDAIDTLVDFNGRNVLIIDTAGIRRRGRIEVGVERYSVSRSLRAIERADVVLLVMDASQPISAQDLHIAGYIQEAAKGVVLVVNKWDLAAEKNRSKWTRYIKSQFKFLSYSPVVYTSAKLEQGVDKVMPEAYKVYQERIKHLSTSEVNSVVQQAVATHSLPKAGHKQLKVFSATQAGVNPPRFVFFVNDPKLVHFSYQHYLENKLRQVFGFAGTPIQLVFKAREET